MMRALSFSAARWQATSRDAEKSARLNNDPRDPSDPGSLTSPGAAHLQKHRKHLAPGPPAPLPGKDHLQGEVVMAQEVFSILAVCTGNICRSPAVERLLASQVAPSVSVSSAGTHALVGHPISEPMATLLRQAAVEPEPF